MPSNRDPSLAGGKVYASRILSQVKDVVETEVDRTTVFDSDLENDILKFHSTELKLGKVIGRGGFCVVNELVGIQLLLGDDDDVSDMSQTSSLASLASICRRKFSRATTRFTTTPAEDDFDTRTRKTLSQAVGKARTAKYVVKKVEPKLLQKDPATYLKGTVDIALEAKYLAAMQHPNIIRIKALSAASADQEFGYFIVLDRMVDLLSKRLNDWMQRHRATQGMTGLITRGKRRSNELLVERLMVALDVSNALSYIHSRGVVYRDLVSSPN
jgi:serine/threonine protein kinase